MGSRAPKASIKMTTRTRSRRRRRKAEETSESAENEKDGLGSSGSSKCSNSTTSLRRLRRQQQQRQQQQQQQQRRRQQQQQMTQQQSSQVRRRGLVDSEQKAVYSLSVEDADDVIFRLSPITEDRPPPLGGQFTVVTTNRRQERDSSSDLSDSALRPTNNRTRRRRRQRPLREESLDSEGMILCVVPLAAATSTEHARGMNRRNNSTNNRYNPSGRRRQTRVSRTPDYPTSAILCEIEMEDDNEVMYEVEDVHYEPVSNCRLGKQRLRDWRLFARYELTPSESLKQEKELYYSFNEIKEPDKNEGVRLAKPGEPSCCVCYENAATRVVVPCGHQCLCYLCAANIAMNRTVFYGSRLPKLCPLCQAVIGLIPKLC